MQIKYSDINFQLKDNIFQHNLNHDFGCIALWKSARPFRDKIRELLSSQFEILLETEIQWSPENFETNANRLYEAPIHTNLNGQKSSHSKKIGDYKFIIFIIKDSKPNYTYAQSVSGKIELSNLNIVNAKYQARDWVQEKSGVKYGVHSTNNIQEFFFQVPLLLGIDRFNKLLKGEKIIEEQITKDLEGAEGWKNYKELFDILNLTTNYLVQRGFETLPEKNPEMDIDFLTDNHQRLASALGAAQNRNQTYKGIIKVANEDISVDMRYVGDKYYDPVWQRNMLENKVKHRGVYVPRADDYFFSLLYHAKVQKPNVKEKYIPRLAKLASELQFHWYKTELLNDNIFIAKALKGFYSANNYFYEDPVDKGVYKNKEITDLLSDHFVKKQKKFVGLKTKIYPYIPDFVLQLKKKN